MTASIKGPWSEAQIDEFLQLSVFPVRLACTAADGFPRVVSVWFRYRQGRFYCVSHRDSKLISLLRDSDKIGFEVSPNEPPYCGVRGQGIASLMEEGAGEELEHLLQRYLGGADSSLGNWLLSRRDEEVLIEIQPHRIFSWDYRQRMSDA
jgi:nitroimidazol reductase NimA-like FMN-containing flavoprotein (pyridoxamine 5'-phosphate oxidase superfamily)